MNSEPKNFIEAFKVIASPILARHSQLNYVWENLSKNGAYRLRILKNSTNGFDVGVEVQSYGLYPFAGDWRGAPWDITISELVLSCNCALGLVRALLSTDMRLRVQFSGTCAYKSVIEQTSPNGWKPYDSQRMAFFYNYFANQSEQIFQNNQLPQQGFATGLIVPDWSEMSWA